MQESLKIDSGMRDEKQKIINGRYAENCSPNLAGSRRGKHPDWGGMAGLSRKWWRDTLPYLKSLMDPRFTERALYSINSLG